MVAGAVDGGGWHRRRRFEIRQRRIVGETVLHAVGAAVDDDGVGAVQEAVEDGGGDAGVVVEDGRPLFVGLVGGEDNRAALVALADDLEEQIGAGFVEGRFTSPGGGRRSGLDRNRSPLQRSSRGRCRVDLQWPAVFGHGSLDDVRFRRTDVWLLDADFQVSQR
jgi:hypothetical protein